MDGGGARCSIGPRVAEARSAVRRSPRGGGSAWLFNDPARAVVVRALEEARGLGHRYLGILVVRISTCGRH
jgi:hypothetical protein